MEKVLRMAAVLVLGMLLLLTMAGHHQEVEAQGLSIPMSLDSIDCKVLGNCEKKDGGRALDQANKYNRGCSAISQCRGGDD
jgi:hypothetical protein